MMSWVIGKLKCWAGYHEKLVCGGHRALVMALHRTGGECSNAHCPRCGKAVMTQAGAIVIGPLINPLPEARALRRIPQKGGDKNHEHPIGEPMQIPIRLRLPLTRLRRRVIRKLKEIVRQLDLPKKCSMCERLWDHTWSYMVVNELWEEAGLVSHELCCLPCLQELIPRRLSYSDFPSYPINYQLHWAMWQGSELSIESRLVRGESPEKKDVIW